MAPLATILQGSTIEDDVSVERQTLIMKGGVFLRAAPGQGS